MIVQETLLRCTAGNSRKEYRLQIIQNQDGTFTVLRHSRAIGAAWVPQGTLATGVTRQKAQTEANKMQAQKERKGYVMYSQQNTTPSAVAPQSPQPGPSPFGGMKAKVNQAVAQAPSPALKVVWVDQLGGLLQDDGLMMTASGGGQILRATKRDEIVAAIEPLIGISMVELPKAARTHLVLAEGSFILDFEVVGKEIVLLDMLMRNGQDLRGLSLKDRFMEMVFFFGDNKLGDHGIRLAFYEEGEAKDSYLLTLMDEGAQALNFVRADGAYAPEVIRYAFPKTARGVVMATHPNGMVSLASRAINAGPAYAGLPPALKGLEPGMPILIGQAKCGALAPALNQVVEFRYRHLNGEGSLVDAYLERVLPGADPASCSLADLHVRLDD